MNWSIRYAKSKLQRCPWCNIFTVIAANTGGFDPLTGKGTKRPTFAGQFPFSYGGEDIMPQSMVDEHNEQCGVTRECTPEKCGINAMFTAADMLGELTKEQVRSSRFDDVQHITPLHRALLAGRHSGAQRQGIEFFSQQSYPVEEMGDVCTEHGCTAVSHEQTQLTAEQTGDRERTVGELTIDHSDSCPNKKLGPVSSPILRGACQRCGHDIKPNEYSIRWKNPTSQNNSFVNPNKPGSSYVRLSDRIPTSQGLKDLPEWEKRFQNIQDNLRALGVNQRPEGSPPNPTLEGRPTAEGGVKMKLGPHGGTLKDPSRTGKPFEDMLDVMPMHHTDQCKAIQVLQSQCPAHQGKDLESSEYEFGMGGGIHFTSIKGEKPLADVTQLFYEV